MVGIDCSKQCYGQVCQCSYKKGCSSGYHRKLQQSHHIVPASDAPCLEAFLLMVVYTMLWAQSLGFWACLNLGKLVALSFSLWPFLLNVSALIIMLKLRSESNVHCFVLQPWPNSSAYLQIMMCSSLYSHGGIPALDRFLPHSIRASCRTYNK